MKLSSLLTAKHKITEKRKMFFIIPALVVVLALIAGVIFGFVSGSPLNLTPDFVDSYSMTVRSSSFTEDNFKEYNSSIKSIIESYEDADGKSYGLKVYESHLQGTADSPSIYIKYSGVRGDKSEKELLMKDEINPGLQEKIQSIFDIKALSADYSSSKVTLGFGGRLVELDFDEIKAKITDFCNDNGITATDIKLSEDKSEITFSSDSSIEAKLDALKQATLLNKAFAGKAEEGVKITAVVTNAILWISIAAVIAAIILLAVYVAFRFEVSSAVAVCLGALCDVVLMLSAMTVFHISLNALFFAAVALILVFSSITKLTVFERIREYKKLNKNNKSSRFEIANTAVSDTMVRNFNTTLVMLALTVLVGAIAVPAVRLFAIPVLFGLISNAFTTVCLSPSVWTLFKGVEFVARVKKPKASKVAEKAEKVKAVKNESPVRAARPEIIEPVAETPVTDTEEEFDITDSEPVEPIEEDTQEAVTETDENVFENDAFAAEIETVETQSTQAQESETVEAEDVQPELEESVETVEEEVVQPELEEGAETVDTAEVEGAAEIEEVGAAETESEETDAVDAQDDVNATADGEES